MKVPRAAILVVGGIAIAGGGLFGAAAAFGSPLPFGPKPGGAEHPTRPVSGVPYPMRERIVNLADTGVLRYLKVTIVLEVFDPEHPHGITAADDHKGGKPELPKDLRHKSAALDDHVTTVLTAKTAGDLMAPDGKARLKEELQRTLNGLLGDERVLAVYFVDFIIQ